MPNRRTGGHEQKNDPDDGHRISVIDRHSMTITGEYTPAYGVPQISGGDREIGGICLLVVAPFAPQRSAA